MSEDEKHNFLWAARKLANRHKVARELWPAQIYLFKPHGTVRITEHGGTSIFYKIDGRAICDILSNDWIVVP